nr:trace amine-associated receptor 5-like [Lytechinus pictus]
MPSTPSLADKRYILDVVWTFLAVVGVVGNLFVLVVIGSVKELRGVTNLLIANQSLIDLLSSLLVFLSWIPPLPISEEHFIRSKLICVFFKSRYLFWGSVLASTFNLVFINLERYYAVLHPIKYKINITSKRGVQIAILPWVTGYGFQIYSFFSTRLVGMDCQRRFQRSGRMVLGVIVFLSQYLFPLVIMLYVHTRIAATMKNRVGNGQEQTQDIQRDHQDVRIEVERQAPVPNYRVRARKNIIKSLFTVTVIFAVCWTPNQITYLVYNLGGRVNFLGVFYNITVAMATCNMCCNPFIYTFQYRKFQKGVRTLDSRGMDLVSVNGQTSSTHSN